MHAIRHEAAMNAEATFYKAAPLGLVEAHTRPSRNPFHRVPSTRSIERVLGESCRYLPENLPQTLKKVAGEDACRAAGAVRRLVFEISTPPIFWGDYTRGIGSPSNAVLLYAIWGLKIRSWNADRFARDWATLCRWRPAGANPYECLMALAENSRPRRAAMALRGLMALRLWGRVGSSGLSWSKVRRAWISHALGSRLRMPKYPDITSTHYGWRVTKDWPIPPIEQEPNPNIL